MTDSQFLSDAPFYSDEWVGDLAAYWLARGEFVETHGRGLIAEGPFSRRETLQIEIGIETLRVADKESEPIDERRFA